MKCVTSAVSRQACPSRRLPKPAKSPETPNSRPLPVRRRGADDGCNRFREDNNSHEARSPWWCDIDSINQNRTEKLFAAWSMPLVKCCEMLEAKCEELAQRLDACEQRMGESSALKSRLTLLETVCFSQSRAINTPLRKKVGQASDAQTNQKLFGVPPLAERGNKLTKQEGQTARLNASAMLNTSETFIDKGHGALSNQTHRTDTNGFEGKIAKATLGAVVNDSLTQEVKKFNKCARLRQLPLVLVGSASSSSSNLHAPETAGMQRGHSHACREPDVLWQGRPPSLQQQRSAGCLKVLQPGVSGIASRGLSWHAGHQLPAVPENVYQTTI